MPHALLHRDMGSNWGNQLFTERTARCGRNIFHFCRVYDKYAYSQSILYICSICNTQHTFESVPHYKMRLRRGEVSWSFFFACGLNFAAVSRHGEIRRWRPLSDLELHMLHRKYHHPTQPAAHMCRKRVRERQRDLSYKTRFLRCFVRMSIWGQTTKKFIRTSTTHTQPKETPHEQAAFIIIASWLEHKLLGLVGTPF